MDRRRFLATAGALSAHSLLSPSFKAFAQQDPYASLAFANSVAVGNGCHTVARASDWYALQAAFSSVLSDWMANNRDADVKATAGYVDPSWVSSAGINMAAYAGQFQSYQPAVQVGDLQTAAAYIDMKAPSTVPWVLEVFQSDGMEFFLANAVQEAGKIGDALLASGGSIQANVVKRRPGMKVPYMRPPQLPPGNGDGGGGKGYTCAVDGAIILTAGIAFATIGFMTGGLGFFIPALASVAWTPVLAGGMWGTIAATGGTAVFGWGIGHAVNGCSF
jgi:hypothetical protein